MNLHEAKKEEFLLYMRDNTFPVVSGTRLDDQFFAYNTKDSWTLWSICDIDSGWRLKHEFPTLTACKEYLANLPDDIKEKVQEQMNTQEYKDCCKVIAAEKAKRNMI